MNSATIKEGGEAHLDHDVELEVEPLPVVRMLLLGDVMQAQLQSFAGIPAEEAVDVARTFRSGRDAVQREAEILGGRERFVEECPVRVGIRLLCSLLIHDIRRTRRGEVVGVHLELELAARGDLCRTVDGLAVFGEEGAHLLLRLDVLLVRGQSLSIGRVQRLSSRDGVQQIEGHGVGILEVATVICDHRLDAELGPQSAGACVGFSLTGEPDVLQLEEQVLGAEDVEEGLCPLPGGVEVAATAHAERSMDSAGEDNQALSMGLELLEVDARAEVHAIEDRGRHERAQVVVPLRRLNQEDEIPSPIRRAVIELVYALGPNPELGPKHGMNPGAFSGLVELDGPVEIAGVGQRDRLHLERLGPSDDLSRPHRAIENGVLTAVVEVNEGHDSVDLIRHRPRSSPCPHPPIIVSADGGCGARGIGTSSHSF